MAVIPLSPTVIRNGLRSPYNLAPAQFTYSIPDADSVWETSPGNYTGSNQQPFTGYSVLSAAQAADFRSAMTAWDRVIAADFVEVADTSTSHGEVRVAFTSDGMTPSLAGYAFQGSNQTPTSIVGDIWLNSDSTATDFSAGTDDYVTLLHEIGHVLGLKHPFEGTVIPAAYDDTRYTVMSYTVPFAMVLYVSGPSIFIEERIVNALTPGVLDIVALQELYGQDTSTATGNTVYTFDQDDLTTQVIHDAGGLDTIDLTGITRGSTVDLRPGAYSSIAQWTESQQIAHYAALTGLSNSQVASYFAGDDYYEWTDNLGIAFSTTIENAIGGSGNDVLFGNDAVNDLRGMAGNDRYYLGAGDIVFESAGAGNDLILTNADFALADTVFVESLSTSNNAATDAIDISGNNQANVIVGNAGANVLDGGGGADMLQGLAGDDRYHVDNVADRVFEAAGGGTDTIASSISLVLADTVFVENLRTINDAATTTISLTGNSQANSITGNAGANVLNGGGGADTLHGLGGNDRYYIDNAADLIVDTSGNDILLTGVDYVLGAAAVESLATRNLAGTDAIDITGNAIANVIVGNAGANILDGGGGADILQGLGGNDRYVVDNAADRVIEAAGGGTDTIMTSISLVLGDTVFAEILRTTSDGSTAAINLTGNVQANTLVGNAGANVLNGGGGADTLQGLGGNDRYYIDNAADVVIEVAGGGNDILLTSVDYVLPLAAIVESLTTRNQAGGEAIDIAGNDIANVIVGNAGANVLRGQGGNDLLQGLAGADLLYGGAGHDRLFGGAGADQLVFDTALGSASNVDKLEDFVVADDTIVLDRSIFAAIAANGVLAAGAFRSGAAAGDADDRIVHNQATGQIFYDADGNGGLAATLFATIAAGTALTNADFLAIA